MDHESATPIREAAASSTPKKPEKATPTAAIVALPPPAYATKAERWNAEGRPATKGGRPASPGGESAGTVEKPESPPEIVGGNEEKWFSPAEGKFVYLTPIDGFHNKYVHEGEKKKKE